MIDEKAIEHRLILILRSAASFQEKAALVVPFRKASVVMELHIIRNHEQDNAIRQAFFEHDGAVDAPVVVLERVNALESSAKPDDILERPIRRVMPTKNTRTSSATRSGGMVGQPTTSFERRFQSPPPPQNRPSSTISKWNTAALSKAGKRSPFNASLRTVVAYAARRNAPFLRSFDNRHEVHSIRPSYDNLR